MFLEHCKPGLFNRNCANSCHLLLTLSVSHSLTSCQTTTPPLKTHTPRSVLWMERRPGWTVRLCHTGHESIFHTVCQSDCRVCEGFVWKQRVCCTVMWYDTGGVFAPWMFHSLVRTCTWLVLLHRAELCVLGHAAVSPHSNMWIIRRTHTHMQSLCLYWLFICSHACLQHHKHHCTQTIQFIGWGRRRSFSL